MATAETTLGVDAGIAGRVTQAVRDRPFVAVAAAGAVGVALGGIVFSRLGKLLFLAIAGYVVSDLWRREGHLDVQELLRRLSNDRRSNPHS